MPMWPSRGTRVSVPGKASESARAEAGGEVVEPLDVPVGIGQQPRLRGEALGDVGRDMGAAVGNADQKRRRTLVKIKYFHSVVAVGFRGRRC